MYTPGVSQRRSGATTYDLPDRLGTASRQTDATASTIATRTYDAFGMALATTGAPQGPFGFAAASGYQEDPDSGLKLLGHRYYDASTGRFLTRDPVKDGRNWFEYCGNNPLKSTDSTGYVPINIGHPPDDGFASPGVYQRYPENSILSYIQANDDQGPGPGSWAIPPGGGWNVGLPPYRGPGTSMVERPYLLTTSAVLRTGEAADATNYYGGLGGPGGDTQIKVPITATELEEAGILVPIQGPNLSGGGFYSGNGGNASEGGGSSSEGEPTDGQMAAAQAATSDAIHEIEEEESGAYSTTGATPPFTPSDAE